MKTLAALIALAGLAHLADAALIASWTFETSVPATAGPHVAEGGANAATSNASGSHANATVAYTNPAGNGSNESYSADKWAINDYFQFTTSTTGFTGINIGWDQTSSNTGPRDFEVQYSTNGINFTSLTTYQVLGNGVAPNAAWTAATNVPAYGFVAPGAAALDNKASITIRFVNTSTVAVNSPNPVVAAGTNRMDNVIITGTLVPTPASLALLGVGGLVAGRRRR